MNYNYPPMISHKPTARVMEFVEQKKENKMQVLLQIIFESLLQSKAKLMFGAFAGSLSGVFLFVTMPELDEWVKVVAAIVAAMIVPGVKVWHDIKDRRSDREQKKERHQLKMDGLREQKFFELLDKLKQHEISFEGLTPEEILEKVKEYAQKL